MAADVMATEQAASAWRLATPVEPAAGSNYAAQQRGFAVGAGEVRLDGVVCRPLLPLVSYRSQRTRTRPFLPVVKLPPDRIGHWSLNPKLYTPPGGRSMESRGSADADADSGSPALGAPKGSRLPPPAVGGTSMDSPGSRRFDQEPSIRRSAPREAAAAPTSCWQTASVWSPPHATWEGIIVASKSRNSFTIPQQCTVRRNPQRNPQRAHTLQRVSNTITLGFLPHATWRSWCPVR